MFHFSTDRLAGLDAMILKITDPPKVPTLIPNHIEQKRLPLADRTNLAPRPLHETSSMLLHFHSTCGSDSDSPPRAPSSSADVPAFRPLPPLPSASTLQLPSFLNFSDQSFTSLADPPSLRSTTSVVRKTKDSKVFEGPQWIPAFHHPNSPYVPWPDPVRRRILPPSPTASVCPTSPCIRSGAVAPEPWTSSTVWQTKSGKERLFDSWKSFKYSIKHGVKSVVSRLGKAKISLNTLCTSQDMLRTCDDIATATIASDVVRSTGGPRDSLASFVSSDSKTLAAWLAERRAETSTSYVIDDAARVMSVEEYELMGSWLDLRHNDGGWLCGIQDCDMHTIGGSPYSASEYPDGLRTGMPLESADFLSSPQPSPPLEALLSFPTGPFYTSPRFHSLPRLPSDSCAHAERCSTRCREVSMPGSWTFNCP